MPGDWIRLTSGDSNKTRVDVNLNNARFLVTEKNGTRIKFGDDSSILVAETSDAIIAASTNRGRSM